MPSRTRRKQRRQTFKRSPSLLVALLVGSLLGYEVALYHNPGQATYVSDSAAIQVRFSPGGHCTQFIEDVIAKAQKTIFVQAYAFTSAPITDALIAAHHRGVLVRMLVDRSQRDGKYTQVPRVLQAGIPVAIDKVPGIAHNKIMIIDDQYVLTGSFNWTKAAETRNAENLLLINDPATNRIYKAMWQQRAARAQAIE
ncbi:MAG: phospholipase D family protein [Bacteroidota bacterium]